MNKFILTAGLNHLTESQFMKNTNGKLLVMEQNHTLVPVGLSPTVVAGRAVFDQIESDIDDRTALEEQLKSKNEQIAAGKSKLNDIIVTNWMPVLQVSLNGDVANAKLLGYAVKGMDLTPSPVSVASSYPAIVNVKTNVHLQLTLEVENNESKEIIMPSDGKGIDVFMYVGDTEPTGSFKKFAQYCGRASHGKFTQYFSTGDVGKNVFFYTCYVPKKPNIGLDLCGKVKIMVV
jgi:hypothetical protein